MTDDSLLIVTERRRWPRLFDAVITLVAWLLFVYLFFNGFIAVLQSKASAQEHLHFGLLFATVATLATYFVIGLINALVLYCWAMYNQFRRRIERRNAIPALTNEQLRNSFDLPVGLLQTLRGHQVCSVHNDGDGNIVGVSIGSVYANDSAQPHPVAEAARTASPAGFTPPGQGAVPSSTG